MGDDGGHHYVSSVPAHFGLRPSRLPLFLPWLALAFSFLDPQRDNEVTGVLVLE